jgi:hypothetical protein
MVAGREPKAAQGGSGVTEPVHALRRGDGDHQDPLPGQYVL